MVLGQPVEISENTAQKCNNSVNKCACCTYTYLFNRVVLNLFSTEISLNGT